MDLKGHKLILASASPRRRELLLASGLDFDLRPLDVDETHTGIPVLDVAEQLSIRKAHAIDLDEHEIVITADTVVVVDEDILGKPVDEEDAKRMIRMISGRGHKVITGVTIRSAKKESSFSENTEVHFRELSEAEIDFYVQEYKPMDKAGAYGIQEWIGMVGVERLVGDYFNVVGLPVQSLYLALKDFVEP